MTTRRSRLLVTVLVLVVCVSFAGRRVSGQFRYWSGQNVVPVFEGWERNPDGSFNFVFGYFNRNYEETLDILVGPDNNVEPGGPDRGQPTFFAPARQKFLFRVRVPKDWPATQRLVWTLAVRGKTEKANAFLLPEWEMNSQVMALNGGGGGGGGIDEDYNQPPVITFAKPVNAASPDVASVVASVTDDGLPKPRAARRGGPPRALLRVAWLQFRGPVGGRVSFSPSSSPVENGKAETMATFTMPGQYSLLGIAMDGGASSTATVAVDAGARR